jgi:hypothetical protein
MTTSPAGFDTVQSSPPSLYVYVLSAVLPPGVA